VTTSDKSPCAANQVSHSGHQTQTCPLVSGKISVYDSPDQGNLANQVGTLNGDANPPNWFVGQSYRSNFVKGTTTNHWWAFTLSDKDSSGHSHWGWVPEVYFKGGANDERDAGLFICNTHGNDCNP
jgi:hypothetical protein